MRTFVFASALALAFASGCGSSSGSGSGGGTSSSAGGGSPPSPCADDPRVEAYTVGLEATSDDGAVTVRFVDANPAPPEKGNNTFTVDLVDGSGHPIDGASISTKSYMPDHGHASPTMPPSKA